MSEERAHRVIAWVTTLILLFVSFIVARAGSTYRFAFLFLLPILWTIYLLRYKLVLHPLHYALFASFLLFHDLGVFGFYRGHFLGLQFDVYVHFYFGFVAGLIALRAFRIRCGWHGWWLVAATALFILGIGAVHELVECGTTILLGKEKGMLKLDPNDPYDTQKDLMNNLLGMLVAAFFSKKRAANAHSKDPHSGNHAIPSLREEQKEAVKSPQ